MTSVSIRNLVHTGGHKICRGANLNREDNITLDALR